MAATTPESSEMAKMLEDDPEYDPPDFAIVVMEAILSKLSIQSLRRMRTVSKSWNAIICSPQFNIQRSRSQPQNLFIAWRKPHARYLTEVRLDLEEQVYGKEQSYRLEPSLPLYSSNGIILLKTPIDDEFHLWLFAPTYSSKGKILSQHKFEDFSINHGHYYDSRNDDYRVVVLSRKRFGDETYSVYSCRKRIWDDEKPFPDCGGIEIELEKGFFVDGCFYWWVRKERKLVYFDVREEKLMRLTPPKEVKEEDERLKIKLTEVAGRLCLYSKSKDWINIRVWVMDKVHKNGYGSCFGSWRELVKIDRDGSSSEVSSLRKEDYVVHLLDGSESLEGARFLVYDDLVKSYEVVHGFDFEGRLPNFLPFTQSLFNPTRHMG